MESTEVKPLCLVNGSLRHTMPNDKVRVPRLVLDDSNVEDVRATIIPLPNGESPGFTNLFGGAIRVQAFKPGRKNRKRLERFGFRMELPQSYRVGTDIWLYTQSAGLDERQGNVRWKIVYSAAVVGEAFSKPTEITLISYAMGAMVHAVSSQGKVPGDKLRSSAVILGSVYRDCLHREDDYMGPVALLTLDAVVEVDEIGGPKTKERE